MQAEPTRAIDADLARRLVTAQFPQWRHLPVRPVERGGWDNRSFRLGDALVARLPSRAEYATQVAIEQQWLPRLAPTMPLPIPDPIALGQPAVDYPWSWSVRRWIDGVDAAKAPPADLCHLARDLALFLRALQAIDAAGGPAPGARNFHRGGSLAVYDGQTRQALLALEGQVDRLAATKLWDAALASRWTDSPLWVHGDIAAGNLLLRDDALCAVIDFGGMAIGDPACDLSIAWTLLDEAARAVFREILAPDAETWARGRGWALWKALIVLAGLCGTDPSGAETSRRVVGALLSDDSKAAN